MSHRGERDTLYVATENKAVLIHRYILLTKHQETQKGSQNPNDNMTICFSLNYFKGDKQAINKKKQKVRKLPSYTHAYLCVIVYMCVCIYMYVYKNHNHEHRSCYTLYVLYEKYSTEHNQIFLYLLLDLS